MSYVTKVRYLCQVCLNQTLILGTNPYVCQACMKSICKRCKTSNFCDPCLSHLPEKEKRKIEILNIFVSLFRGLLYVFFVPFVMICFLLIVGIFVGSPEDLWELEFVNKFTTIYLVGLSIFLGLWSIEQKLCKKNIPIIRTSSPMKPNISSTCSPALLANQNFLKKPPVNILNKSYTSNSSSFDLQKFKEKLHGFERLSHERWRNYQFLTLIKEYWKANFLHIPYYGEITYIFWLFPDPPDVEDHLVVYFDIKHDNLIPHLIRGQIPKRTLENSILFCGFPASFNIPEKSNLLEIIPNLNAFQMNNLANVYGAIFQLLSKVAIRMDEGFKGNLVPENNVRVQEQSSFYNPQFQQNIPQYGFLDASGNVSFTSSTANDTQDPQGIEIPSYCSIGGLLPNPRYTTPTYNGIPAFDPYNFQNAPPDIISDLHNRKAPGMAVEKVLHEQYGFHNLPHEIVNQFLPIFFSILEQEGIITKENSVNQPFCLAKSMTTLLLKAYETDFSKMTWNAATNNLLSYGLIDPMLKPPHLTQKGNIMRELLLLGGFTNMKHIYHSPFNDMTFRPKLLLKDFDEIKLEWGTK